jgi:hypothetical protein
MPAAYCRLVAMTTATPRKVRKATAPAPRPLPRKALVTPPPFVYPVAFHGTDCEGYDAICIEYLTELVIRELTREASSVTTSEKIVG